MTILRGLSIPKRLWLLLAIAILGFVFILALSLNQLKHTLTATKEDNTRMLVETAYSIVDQHYKNYQSGKMSETLAQQAAINDIQNLRYDNGNYFWINDMQPKMIMHPTNPSLNGKDISNNQDPTGKRLFSDMVDVVKQKGEGLVPYMWPLPGSKEPVAKISYVKGFKPWGWIIGSGVYLQDIEQAYTESASGQISLFIIVLLIVALGAAIIIRSITVPLEEVVDALKEIARGDKDLTKRLPDKGKDEVSALAHAFNEFAEQIENIIDQVKQATIQLNSSTNHLNQVVEASEESISRQQAQSNAVLESVHNLTLSVEKISQSATDAIQAAKDTQTTANQGEGLVIEAKNSVSVTESKVTEASHVITQLAKNSQNISGVLDVIRGIAEQTNLLALNAAIEAARAGEQGRGFAVVADEVRALAAKTQSSTEEIRNMIDALQAGSSKAVDAIKSGEESTQVTVEKADTAAQSLHQIVTAITQIDALNQDISAEVQAQYAVSEEVTEAIKNITASTQSSHESIQTTAKSCNQLTQMSENLSRLVQQFKLS
ncbi:methyl-accepting chemotaxis protein [Catenovulum sp. 2E275]|uniref:methyl-accepting chemotaxis protein n=1 Tax=Catenovulum sp. 2E275 TaxID=2980497 RepID=UPI0021D26C18|nr:methyl-accepting chemotaxis protein [Catenovulum sp. 2E275]MCU4677168.1 methyl-accepting chemotaxis protein [Catenovulum sp. 2E275]